MQSLSEHYEESPYLLRLHLQFAPFLAMTVFEKISNPPIPPFRKGGLMGDLKNGEVWIHAIKVAAKAREREGVET